MLKQNTSIKTAVAQSFKANNGDIITIKTEDNEGVFIFQDNDSHDESNQNILNFLHEVKDHFFGYHEKYSEQPDQIKMYLSVGREADTRGHVKAFLNDLLFNPSETLITKVTDAIQNNSEY